MNWPEAFAAAVPHIAAAAIALTALKVVYLRTAPQPAPRCPWCDDDDDDDGYAVEATEADEADADDDWRDDPDWWKRERNGTPEQ